MFPSFHEFKSELAPPLQPLQPPSHQLHHYDPYFPSHNATASSPPVTVTSIAENDYNTYQNGGGYSQYTQPQSWSGSSTGSQPSPQPPHNNYYDGGGPGPPPNGNDYYNSQQPYPPSQQQQQQQQQQPPPQPSQAPSSNQNMSYYSPQCNQYDQYNYNYNGWNGPPPGSSPPLYHGQYVKNEYVDLKASPSPPQQPQGPQHPGAIPYYGGPGNGQAAASPHHSPHLMSMQPSSMMQQQQPPQPPQPQQNHEWSNKMLAPLPVNSPNLANGKRPKPFGGPQTKITDHPEFKAKKPRSSANKRATNRFNGMSEEEVAKRGLPDYLKPGLDIVFIGINPSMFAAYTGKYYDGPGNHFWQALYLSGILAEPMSAVDDHKLLDLGIGFTNIVPRTTRGLSDLSRKEIADGAEVLREKLCKFKPKVAVFNGKAIYEVYSGQKKFMFGRQPEPLNDGATWLWVMPSSSARCAQLPRAVDKVPFFEALRKFRDYLTGRLPRIEDCEVVFANVSLRNWTANNAIKSEAAENETEEVNPNLQPFTDGVPANVPQSVTEVIEDVIRKYSMTTPTSAASGVAAVNVKSEESEENSVGSNAQ